jgi:hypothetical protein
MTIHAKIGRTIAQSPWIKIAIENILLIIYAFCFRSFDDELLN